MAEGIKIGWKLPSRPSSNGTDQTYSRASEEAISWCHLAETFMAPMTFFSGCVHLPQHMHSRPYCICTSVFHVPDSKCADLQLEQLNKVCFSFG